MRGRAAIILLQRACEQSTHTKRSDALKQDARTCQHVSERVRRIGVTQLRRSVLQPGAQTRLEGLACGAVGGRLVAVSMKPAYVRRAAY